MKFLPCERFTIETNKSIAETKFLLISLIEPKMFIDTAWGPTTSKNFCGKIDNDKFNIKPISSMGGSIEFFTIRGKIKENQVDVEIKPGIFLIAVLAGLTFIAMIGSTMTLLPGTTQVTTNSFGVIHTTYINHPDFNMIVIPIILLAFAYLIAYVIFKYEALGMKNILIELLGNKPVNNEESASI